MLSLQASKCRTSDDGESSRIQANRLKFTKRIPKSEDMEYKKSS
jgi:hypothetical protein